MKKLIMLFILSTTSSTIINTFKFSTSPEEQEINEFIKCVHERKSNFIRGIQKLTKNSSQYTDEEFEEQIDSLNKNFISENSMIECKKLAILKSTISQPIEQSKQKKPQILQQKFLTCSYYNQYPY